MGARTALRHHRSAGENAVVAWGWYSIVEFSGALPREPAPLGGAALAERPRHARAAFWAAWWTEDPRQAPDALPDVVGIVEGYECHAGAIDDADAALRRAKGQFVYALHVPPEHAIRSYRSGAKVRQSHVTDFITAAFKALALPMDATAEQIRKAFRLLAHDAHPDHGGSVEALDALKGHKRVALAYVLEQAARGVMGTAGTPEPEPAAAPAPDVAHQPTSGRPVIRPLRKRRTRVPSGAA